jgi:hypothetical protein
VASNDDARQIAARIFEGMLSPPPTFAHDGLTHTVEEYVRLPQEFHDPETRLAPIQIVAHAGELGARVVVCSGTWQKYVTHPRGFGLIENPDPKEDVLYEPTGTLCCHPWLELEQAPLVGAAWLGTICSLVRERSPTVTERQKLSDRNIALGQVGFFHARALGVRPKWWPLRRR